MWSLPPGDRMTNEQFAELPEAQREGLRKMYSRYALSKVRDATENDTSYVTLESFQLFLSRATFEIGGYGAVMVPYAGMWLGIEKDGYTHS